VIILLRIEINFLLSDLNEFLYTAETLSFGLSERQERENIFEKYIPNIYKSRISKKFKKFVKRR
jgi:hypothetical protein